MERHWDTKLGNTLGKKPMARVIFPSAISTVLIDRGYDRVTITVTEDGLLLKPYKCVDDSLTDRLHPAELPEW